jgi:subtilisin family serine protease
MTMLESTQRVRHLEMVALESLMELTAGSPSIRIALVDGPVRLPAEHFDEAEIEYVNESGIVPPTHGDFAALQHGTFVLGILARRTSSSGGGICPDCTFVVRSIFNNRESDTPTCTTSGLIDALEEVIDANADIVNISATILQASPADEDRLRAVIDHALVHGVLITAAAGNQRLVGDTPLTRHPWVIPVVGFSNDGRPLDDSNLGASIGKYGLGAPGSNVQSISSSGKIRHQSGTSVAVPFVTAALALFLSKLPGLSPWELRRAIARPTTPRRTVIPPMMNVAEAYASLAGEEPNIRRST